MMKIRISHVVYDCKYNKNYHSIFGNLYPESLTPLELSGIVVFSNYFGVVGIIFLVGGLVYCSATGN